MNQPDAELNGETLMMQGFDYCRRRLFLTSVQILSLLSVARSQTYVVKDSPFVKGTTVVIAGREYHRSGWHEFFWGKHYRKEWNAPFRVKNMMLDTARGGLIPFKEGGGRQTKSLRLKNSRGREYVLRSVNKDFGKGLEKMDGTFIARIAKDQVSFGHPFTPLVIVPMAEKLGIFHTDPEIAFIPKQAALGRFNDEYGDQLYMLEERPDEDQSDADNFGYSKNVIGSEKLFEKTKEDNDDRVDQQAFLRARLFDIFLGDWGRHPDNWRWAEFEDGDISLYKPVPRDRDQAFTQIDGLYPDIAGFFVKQIQGFNYKIKSIGDWNYPGRPLDKKFLNDLSIDEWVMTAKELQQLLTDELIESSIRLMPPNLFAVSGETIIEKLKARRDDLEKYAREYYAYLSRKVDIMGSDKKELIRLDLLNRSELSVRLFKINKHDEIADKPFFERQFNRHDTRELYIYGLDKKDVIEINAGNAGKSRINVRFINPGKKDSVVYAAGKKKIKGIQFFNGRKFELDTIHEKKVKFSFIPILTPSSYAVYDRDPLNLFPRPGIKLSAGLVLTPQPWRKAAYEGSHSIHALYGFLRQSFNVGYVGRFRRLAGRWDFIIKGRLDAPAVENYFGTGNNTVLENKTRNYYRTFSNRIYGGIGLERNFQKMHHAELSLIWQSVKYLKGGGDYFDKIYLSDGKGFTRKNYGGFEAAYAFDHSNGSIYPTRGFTFTLGGGALRNLADTGSSFAKVNSAAAVYLPLSRSFTLAFRAGGSTLFGNPEFYQLNRLGGNVELRGYERDRFYGKSVFYTNAELRWLTNTHNYIFNGRAGLVGFYDIGRVWMPGETSNLWHDGYGMGLIIIPYNKVTLTAMYGISSEGDNLFFRAEMFF